MSLGNIDDVDDLLRSSSISERELYEIWERRQPIPDRGQSKKPGRPAAQTGQIPWVQHDLSLAVLFTRRALDKEEFLLVWDAAQEILRIWPIETENDRTEMVRIRMAYATALTRLGFTRDARRELEPCVAAGFQPILGRKLKVEILLQLGDILREESHHAPSKAVQTHTVEEALGFYRRALDLDPERIEALVQTASTSLVLGEVDSKLLEQAHETARSILTLTKKFQDTDGPRVQSTTAEATAHCVLGNIEEAARSYGQLQNMDKVTTAQLAEARHQAQFLAEALGHPRDLFKRAFPPLQLIVFAGHLPDRPGGRTRFPSESVEPARVAIRAQLDAVDARVGLVSASAGADLLFIEALRSRQGTVHIVLPWSQEEFRRTSVQPFEPSSGSPIWEPIFERAIAEAATIREIGQVYEPSSDVGWEYMMEVTAGIALHTARALRLDIQPMVLWDQLPGRGAGGTDSFHGFWSKQLQLEPIIITLPAPSLQDVHTASETWSHTSERSILHQEVKSMLFADIVGYSKLTEKVIPEFVRTFLERVSQLVATSKHAPCSVNTWGDAVYAVFDFAQDAGLFALQLTQLIHEGREDWLAKGLYWEEHSGDGTVVTKHPLNLRVGLHCGPVVMHYDPVVRRLGFTGAHVNRAARIEPVTKVGEVFASEEFAAMAELTSETLRRKSGGNGGSGSVSGLGFVCEYAGSMQLAKGYPGRYRIYRVLPKRQFDLELLAMAIHEAYCEECEKRQDTPETNSSMRPWEKLSGDSRDANRAQAADIPNKLRFLGYELAPNHGIPPSEITTTKAQVEELAIREHGRWMIERQRRGWTYAPERDNARLHHPLLVPWKKLSKKEKEKDRDTIRNLPRLLEKGGFRVRRII